MVGLGPEDNHQGSEREILQGKPLQMLWAKVNLTSSGKKTMSTG